MLGRLHLRSRLILKAAKAELRGDLMNERDCLEKYAFCQGQFTVPLGEGEGTMPMQVVEDQHLVLRKRGAFQATEIHLATNPAADGNWDQLLEAWKDIAAYLRRDIRTVQRWEKSLGLPIHRFQD